ncbi:uncharacterized protein LOC135370837 [Ornithodoros turicata]
MYRRHVTSKQESRLPVGRSHRSNGTTESRTIAPSRDADSSKLSPSINSVNLSDSEPEKLDEETTKAVEPLSRSPKWTRIKNRFEREVASTSRIPRSRRSPLLETASSQVSTLNRRMPVTKGASSTTITSKLITADITNKNFPEKLSVHEFKSAQLAAKRLLESRPKKCNSDGETTCSTRHRPKALRQASPESSGRRPQCQGPTVRKVESNSRTLVSLNASSAAESPPLAPLSVHSDNSVPSTAQDQLSLHLPESRTGQAVPSTAQDQPSLHLPESGAGQAEVNGHSGGVISDSSSVMQTSQCHLPGNVSVTIISNSVEDPARSENASTERNGISTATNADEPNRPQVTPKKVPSSNHVIQINIEHPKSTTEQQQTPSAASGPSISGRKSTCEGSKFSYSALVPYRSREPVTQKASKVASLAKSFENLIHLDSAAQGPQYLKRGTICNRSLPSETIHDMRKRFGKSSSSSPCTTIQRPLSVTLDKTSATVSRTRSFRTSSESLEETQTRPKMQVAVKRSNSIASQSTAYMRAREREFKDTVPAQSALSAVTNSIGLVNSVSSCALLQTVDVQPAERKAGSSGSAAESGEKKFSLVQQAVMNLEASSQITTHKNHCRPIDLSGALATRRKSVEMSKTDFQSLRSRSASASLDDRYFSPVTTNSSNIEKKPALPPKGAGIRQFRQVPPPCASSSSGTSQSITVSVMASLASEASNRVNTAKTRDCARNRNDICASDNVVQKAVRPNQSFLWRLGTRPQVPPPVNGSKDEYAEENIYDTLSNCRSALSSDEGVVVSERSSEESCKSSPVQGSSGRAGSLPKTLQNRFQGHSVDSDEGWADVSDYEFDSCRGAREDKKPAARKDRRSWSHNLHELVTNMNTDESDKGYEDITWELVDTGDSSSSSTTYDHLYEPIYDLLDKDGVPPDLIPETDNVYAAPFETDREGPASHASSSSSSVAHGSSSDTCKNESRCSGNIHLQLSSRFNLVKIKKSTKSATEIGVGVCVENSRNSKSKKKAIVDCILRQGLPHSSSKRNSMFGGASKKETATFYVRLSVDRELFDGEKRRHSDGSDAGMQGNAGGELQNSHSGIAQRNAPRRRPIRRASSSAGTIQRPSMPPPLPPTTATKAAAAAETIKKSSSETEAVGMQRTESSLSFFSGSAVTESRPGSGSLSPIYDTFPPVFGTSLMSDLASYTQMTDLDSTDSSSLVNAADSSAPNTESLTNEESSPDSEPLKSPFLEEPLYQFYQKDLVERACHWHTADGSTTEEDDGTSTVKTTDDSGQTEDSDMDSQLSDQENGQKQQRSAMELLHYGTGMGLRTLWCEVPEVIESGVLANMTPQEARLQEAMFEVITSEASYLKSLNVLVDHFVRCPDFSKDGILHKREWRALFADILPVRNVCENLLADFEKRWKESIVISDVCDILHEHTINHFGVYIRYCSNQIHQDRLLKELRETRPEFVEVLQRLEADTKCHGLNMYSFLMLPMQRITRLPLLVDAIFKRLDIDSAKYDICKETLAALNKVVSECNDGARKMERMEEMLHISRILEFKDCKAIPLISSSRWLVKRGELLRVTFDLNAKRTFGRSVRYSKSSLYLFLFTDLLLLTKKKGEEYYSVVDYCPRNMVQTSSTEGQDSGIFLPPRLPDCCRNLFQMTILQNHEGKTVEMLLSTDSESEKTRWIDALTPVMSSNPDERIYEEWDCPQVQCRHAYVPKQPDELALDESDVVNVFRKMSDGWYEGERIRDGARGWFPASHTVEVINLHVRSRNLRQRYRLLMASQSYLEGQLRGRNGSKGK